MRINVVGFWRYLGYKLWLMPCLRWAGMWGSCYFVSRVWRAMPLAMRLCPFRAFPYFEKEWLLKRYVQLLAVANRPDYETGWLNTSLRPKPAPVEGATIRIGMCSCSYANREIGNREGRNLDDYAQQRGILGSQYRSNQSNFLWMMLSFSFLTYSK